MRRYLSVILAAGTIAIPRFAAPPLLLRDALLNFAKDHGHWAYIETIVNSRGTTIVSVDPSKTYGEQQIPLLIDGRPPTTGELKKYRVEAEESARKADSQASRPKGPAFLWLVIAAQASVDSEDPDTVTYRVPVRKDRTGRIPAEKLKVLCRVNRKRHALEHISITLNDTFREGLVAKADAMDMEVDITAPDSRYGSLVTRIHSDEYGSLLFFPFHVFDNISLSKVRHVTPYDDRFQVQVGPLKTLGF